MRIIVFTGKGGVGKTSVAASTALRAAAAGARTLVMSTDPAHSLGDAFESELGSEPTRIRKGLDGMEIDAQERLERHWEAIQEYASQFLAWAGADPVAAEEITVLPGFEEVFSLTDLRQLHEEGKYDCVVVDCAPTAETLRLLSLPEISRWYMERIFPMERRVVKVVRPVLKRMTSIPTPPDAFFDTLERLYKSLEEIGRVLTDPEIASVRLVVNPEKMVIAEARRMYTYLSLFGYRVDAVIVNRLLPDAIEDPYFVGWKKVQAEHLETIRESFAPTPILTAPLYREEMVGTDLLDELAAEIYQDLDPAAVLHHDEPMSVRKEGSQYSLRVRLPFAEGRVDLNRRGEELILTVGPYRRSILLPQSLRKRDVIDAAFVGADLKVRFGPGARGARGGRDEQGGTDGG